EVRGQAGLGCLHCCHPVALSAATVVGVLGGDPLQVLGALGQLSLSRASRCFRVQRRVDRVVAVGQVGCSVVGCRLGGVALGVLLGLHGRFGGFARRLAGIVDGRIRLWVSDRRITWVIRHLAGGVCVRHYFFSSSLSSSSTTSASTTFGSSEPASSASPASPAWAASDS